MRPWTARSIGWDGISGDECRLTRGAVFVTNFLPTGFHRAYTVPVTIDVSTVTSEANSKWTFMSNLQSA